MKFIKRLIKKGTVLLFAALISTACSQTTQIDSVQKENTDQVNKDTKVLEVMNSPLFTGFGQFIFPTTYVQPDEAMTISHINSLLPYHSHINADMTIEVIEYMQNKVSDAQTIFYDIYTDQEKQEDPSKENTGLFFFKGNKDAPFAIINAGGGFAYVGLIHESFPHALELSKKGYNAFALQYRTGDSQTAMEDLAAAIAFIFDHADELQVSTENYSLWGGSAGARMAAALGSYGTESFGQNAYPRASTVIMQYTGYSDYTKKDPPTYAIVGDRDGIANPNVMQRRINALKQLGIDTKFHVYPNLGHGFGLGIDTSAQGWIDDAIAFWEQHMKDEV